MRSMRQQAKDGKLWLRFRLQRRAILAALLLAGVTTTLQSQAIRVLPPRAKPNSLFNNSSITLGASPASIALQLVAGSQTTSTTPIDVKLILLNPLLTTVNLYAFFGSATSALTGSASLAAIPSSAVYGAMPSSLAVSFTAFTQTDPFNGAASGLHLLSLTGLSLAINLDKPLTIRIDLSGVPQLPADTYIGTMYLQAQIF